MSTTTSHSEAPPSRAERTAHVTCPLCEATCGLEVTVRGDGREPGDVRVRGDRDDVLSRGYLCPKGAAIGELHADPDRLRRPLVKRDGVHVEVSWEEAYAEVARRLSAVQAEHGRGSVAVYFGNPSAHHLAGALYLRPLVRALGTTQVYSAGTVDQVPKMFASGYLFGDVATVAVPDLDHTDHLLLLGGNPLVSNGSMMTAPDVRGKLRRIRERGGSVVVVDPVRTRTADAATEHVAIRPGTDALLLMSLVHTVLDEGLDDLGRLAEHVSGLDEVREVVAAFPPEATAEHTGVDAATTRRLARELAAADRAVVYGRMGTTTSGFGTVASWLVDVLNVVTGNLDRPGGAMFPKAAAGQPNTRPGPRKPFRHGRWHSRVQERPEVMSELPVATLPDEILTPGAGRVRAVVTVGGNPCLSAPDSARMQEAFGSLDLLVCVDPYLNETTRHADVVLPGPSPLERPHYDVLLYQYAVRNVAHWSPAVVDTDVPQEWRTLLTLSGIAAGLGPGADVDALDDEVARQVAASYGVTAAAGLTGPERLVDLMLRGGPYDLTLADVQAAPHGVDLGPLQPRLPEVLSTPSGTVELAAEPFLRDAERLRVTLDEPVGDGLLLVGRRHLRSNNSWMHNLPALSGGTNLCTLQVHPDDAERLGLVDGGPARVVGPAGEVEAPVEVTDRVRTGVVTLPHGWGHDLPGTRGEVAAARPGVNSNLLADARTLDEPTGTATVNAVPVTVVPVSVPTLTVVD
ncbi:MAG: molybdopterin-binding oxidoreductase [Nocardioides sp.]|nr:molybdopterin-binding oxidoreductase [Nocardioides sp.]